MVPRVEKGHNTDLPLDPESFARSLSSSPGKSVGGNSMPMLCYLAIAFFQIIELSSRSSAVAVSILSSFLLIFQLIFQQATG